MCVCVFVCVCVSVCEKREIDRQCGMPTLFIKFVYFARDCNLNFQCLQKINILDS